MTDFLSIISSVKWRTQIFSLASLFVGALYLAGAIWLKSISHKSMQNVQASLYQQTEINIESAELLAIYNSRINDFTEMQKRGRVGDPQRLQWIETVHSVAQAINLERIDYTINNTVPFYDVKADSFDNPIGMTETPMHITLMLRDEIEFLQFFDSLKANADGLFTTEECEITRNPIEKGVHPDHSGFVATCALTWYTIDDVSKIEANSEYS